MGEPWGLGGVPVKALNLFGGAVADIRHQLGAQVQSGKQENVAASGTGFADGRAQKATLAVGENVVKNPLGRAAQGAFVTQQSVAGNISVLALSNTTIKVNSTVATAATFWIF